MRTESAGTRPCRESEGVPQLLNSPPKIGGQGIEKPNMDKSPKRLTLYVDGASRGNPGPAAIGVVIKDEKGATALRMSSSIGRATNNQAEYSALITALEEAKRLGAEHVDIRTDSQLMAEHIQGNYKVRNAHIRPLFEEVKRLLAAFKSYGIDHIPRERNGEADSLANEALNKLKKS